MRTTRISLWLLAAFSVLAALAPLAASTDLAPEPPTGTSTDPSSPALDLLVTKSMLYSAGIKHGVNPYLVMGLAWHESGWNPNAISSAGAVGIMQVMPTTADVSGPALLHRQVNLFDPADNIDMGTAILKNNLTHWHGDLAKALVAYYAGGGAVTEWSRLRDDVKRYVWSVYRNAVAFRDGRGPV
jgi:soluble lytic murein transglycosylase-like protein